MTEAASTPEQNRKTAIALFDHLSNLRFQEARKLLTPDAVWWDPERGSFTTEEMEKTSGPFVENCVNGIKVTIHQTIAEGDRVAVESESYADLKNNTVYNNKYLFLLKFDGPLICCVKEYHNTQHSSAIVAGIARNSGSR